MNKQTDEHNEIVARAKHLADLLKQYGAVEKKPEAPETLKEGEEKQPGKI